MPDQQGRSLGLSRGVHSAPEETILTNRARDFLASGPADVVDLIGHVCSLPYPPRQVAEHLAAAMFSGRTDFHKGIDGKWRLATLEERCGTRVFEASTIPADRFEDLSYVVVDTETTGTSALRGDRITEVAAVVVRNGTIQDTFETLVNPERSIPPYISALTRITWDMVKDKPRFAQVAPDLMSFLSGHVFVAHNAGFDWRFISHEVSRATGETLMGRRLCTVRLARKLLPQLPRRSLDHIARYYGVTIAARHRAGGDALATAECLVRLLGQAGDAGLVTWTDLERFAGARKIGKRRRRPSALPTSASSDLTA